MASLLESLRRETPNESEVALALTELAGIRVDVQRRILSDAVMFRSQLDAGQRDRFNQLLGTADFVQRLAGIVRDPVTQVASPEKE